MQRRSLLQAFDRGDLPAHGLRSENQAAQDGLTVDEDRARTALTELAAVLRTGEAAGLAQDLEEGVVSRKDERRGLAVDGQHRIREGIASASGGRVHGPKNGERSRPVPA